MQDPAEVIDMLSAPLGELPDPLPVPTLAEMVGLDPFDPGTPARVGGLVRLGGKALHRAGDDAGFDGGVRIRPPGSKSLTNRALLIAALADGVSVIDGALLEADDARRMLTALGALGVEITAGERAGSVTVRGTAGALSAPTGRSIFLNNAGTATRFLTAAALLADGPVLIDGNERMRERPIGELVVMLRKLGAKVDELGEPGFVPLRIHPLRSPVTDTLAVPLTQSSQYVSALMMVAPFLPGGLEFVFDRGVTSRSYIDMTARLLRDAAGVEVETVEPTGEDGVLRIIVAKGLYPGFEHEVEPDASGATYLWAAAGLFPGAKVRVPGLTFGSMQSDARFLLPMRQMGCPIEYTSGAADCSGAARLIGIETVDFEQTPDAAMTLAAVASFAEGPTEITGLRTLRVKETDRIAATAAELGRVGVNVETWDDGIRVRPPGVGPRAPDGGVVFETYEDHRMAMSMSLVALRTPGCAIADPACVAKTYPGFFADLASMYTAAVLGAEEVGAAG